jgi:Ta0938
MKTNYRGCAICGSTWGDFWGEIEGEKMFFCCEICLRQLKDLVSSIKRKTGWQKIDEIKIEGDYSGRRCTATSADRSAIFLVRFGANGEIRSFRET